MLLSSWASGPPAAARSPMPPRNPALTFAMRMPCWLTSVGRRGWASVTRFWVCTAAMSGLVPFWKVSVMFAEPSEADCEDIARSEEHTSELQSHVNLVCRLLLEKKKKDTQGK